MLKLEDCYKKVIIYFNEEHMFICPHQPVLNEAGEFLNFLDDGSVLELKRNITIEELQKAIFENLEKSNLYILSQPPKRLGIERHLKVRSYKAATKDKSLISLGYSPDESIEYRVIAYRKENSLVYLKEKELFIKQEDAIKDNQLAKTVVEFMELLRNK
ncbi:hypothetical protein ACFQ3J_23535 [Paenibacillus provencensis]|uniref:Uncharacterized protein n=1 Tax=Paenibacillus provencensis TaxID=441151 RepID=A0ABW3Q6M5_9BACL|nr:hypothetical protein [Paenibacillus sp. MER 78]MCM3130485.1 hypothetical protein [Paenibacillus sp. MER 78]